MNSKREIPGLWWVPGKQDHKWIGTLTLEAGESPKLTCTLPQGFGCEAPDLGEILHGCDQHGKPVTLFYLGATNISTSAALTFLNYTVGFAILGLELASRREFYVNSVTIDLQHLYEWAGISGFHSGSDDRAEGIVVKHKLPELRSFPIDADLSIEIGATGSFDSGFKEKILRENTVIQFKSKKGINFTRLKELISAVRHLIHFGVLCQVYPVRIECKKDGHGVTFQNELVPHIIEVFSSINREGYRSESPDRWIFRFSDFDQTFGQRFGEWLLFIVKFEEALNCYCTTVYHSLPSEVQHICLAQALEAFHAAKYSSLGKIIFKDRVMKLVNDHIKSLDGLVSDPEQFSESVRDNRNYYTHHDSSLASRALTGEKLFRLNEKMKLLFQMCVLTEIGIPSDRFIRLRRQIASEVVDFA